MLSAASRAREALGGKETRVADFLLGAQNSDGGFGGRTGESDLYYSVFAVDALEALGGTPDTTSLAEYLRSFEDGGALDLVHLASLVRLWSAFLDLSPAADAKVQMLHHLRAHRSRDGGFAAAPGGDFGTCYGCFLAVGAHQDLGAEIEDADSVAECVESLRLPDGGYTNQREVPFALAPATAAAVVTLSNIGCGAHESTADWLMSCRREDGGFAALEGAPGSDLLSTATALHALWHLGAPTGDIVDGCRAFVFSLLGDDGAFKGAPDDDAGDCEYTFYALLSLGRLAGWM